MKKTIDVYQFLIDSNKKTYPVLSAVAEASKDEDVKDFVWRLYEALDSPQYRGLADEEQSSGEYMDADYNVFVRYNENFTFATNSFDTVFAFDNSYYMVDHFDVKRIADLDEAVKLFNEHWRGIED